jgi:hypothetical protein
MVPALKVTLIVSLTVTPEANDMAVDYLRTELAQFSATTMYIFEPLKSQRNDYVSL